MAFSTNLFLFVALPIFLLCYYLITIVKKKINNNNFIKEYRLDDILLVLISSIFYSWVYFVNLKSRKKASKIPFFSTGFSLC